MTSTEESINNSSTQLEALIVKNNLPDVLPSAAKYKNDNNLCQDRLSRSSQLTSDESEKGKSLRKAAYLSNQHKSALIDNDFNKIRLSPDNDKYEKQTNSYEARCFIRSALDFHKAHFVETYTQPFTTEGLYNLTNSQSVPLTIVAKLEKELVERLDLRQPSNNIHIFNENPSQKTPSCDVISKDKPDKAMSSPSYGEVQNQLEKFHVIPYDNKKSTGNRFCTLVDSQRTEQTFSSSINPQNINQKVDKASQTDDLALHTSEPLSKKVMQEPVFTEEIECENLCKDLISQLSLSSDKLQQLLGNCN